MNKIMSFVENTLAGLLISYLMILGLGIFLMDVINRGVIADRTGGNVFLAGIILIPSIVVGGFNYLKLCD